MQAHCGRAVQPKTSHIHVRSICQWSSAAKNRASMLNNPCSRRGPTSRGSESFVSKPLFNGVLVSLFIQRKWLQTTILAVILWGRSDLFYSWQCLVDCLAYRQHSIIAMMNNITCTQYWMMLFTLIMSCHFTAQFLYNNKPMTFCWIAYFKLTLIFS